jgi:hypothetical protein
VPVVGFAFAFSNVGRRSVCGAADVSSGHRFFRVEGGAATLSYGSGLLPCRVRCVKPASARRGERVALYRQPQLSGLGGPQRPDVGTKVSDEGER